MKALIALSTSIRSWQDSMEKRWKQLPVKDSRRIVLFCFAFYVCLTLAVLVHVVYQISAGKNTIEIQHISNPVAKVLKDKQERNMHNNEREQ